MNALTLGGGASRRVADVALAAVVLLVVGMMIVPLPTPLLDILLAGNIAIAVLMLLVALYVPSGLAFTSFPTVLLVTTLFRLALNVSSSRLVLLQADAGEVIASFGEFVVRGNYVVGGVVFFLLTLVQFLVIAKGSERVAEVGARFTLDAMPGKQMSIDAELRAGGIDQAEARHRRSVLSRESQFYGAMDGAMKFVKGDAVAGIVITLVNILGGLVIGIAMHDMDAETSLRTYGLLTIGDGLVSQIPALLISTAAGLVVTRVASEDANGSLGLDVATQVFGRPKALLVAATFLVVLAMVPGLPAVPFLVLGGLFGSLGRKLAKEEPPPETSARPAPSRSAPSRAWVPVVVPLLVEVGPELEARLGGTELVTSGLAELRDRFFVELGVVMPEPRVRVFAGGVPGGYEIAVQEVPAARATPDSSLSSEEVVHEIVVNTARALRRRAEELVGLQETQEMLDQLERVYPALVRNVVPKPVSLALLTDVLRRLVGEGVSIRPLREILETLAIHAPTEKDPVELTELVRTGLRRQLTHRHAPSGTMAVYLLDPSIEETVRESIQRTASGSYLAMTPALARDVAGAAKRAAASHIAPLVVLTQPDVRRYVYRLLESEVPDVVVLGYAELVPDVVITPLGRIEI